MRQIDRKNLNTAKRLPNPLRRLLSRPLENKCRKARGVEERRRPSNPHPPRCASQTCFSLEQIKRFRWKTALQKWWAKPTSLSLSCPAQELESWAKPNNHTRWPPPGSASTLASGHLALLKQCLQNSAWAPRWKHPPSQDRPEVNRRLPEGGIQLPLSGSVQSEQRRTIVELDSAARTSDLHGDFTESTWR